MGIDASVLRFLLAARASGVEFTRTLTLGRQELFLDAREISSAFADHAVGLEPDAPARWVADGRWADPLLAHLGAEVVASLDASSFEGATVLADLNDDLPPDVVGAFTCVLDGGTLEHVFDYPQGLRNAMRAVAVGGHLLLINPFDHQAGHGFWQLGPEVPYRALDERSGFRIERVLISEGPDRWWEVADPADVGRRAHLPRDRETLMFVCARRVREAQALPESPQQSDYSALWQGREPGQDVHERSFLTPVRLHDGRRCGRELHPDLVALREDVSAQHEDESAARAEATALRERVAALEDELRRADRTLRAMTSSPSWRLTAPLRTAKRLRRR